MIEQIECVKLDYTFYKGNDCYSDGDIIENRLLDIVRNGEVEEAVSTGNSWPILYHFSDIRQNLIEWYPFEKEAEVLEIGSGCGAITEVLCRKAKSVTCIELSKRRSLINAYRNRKCNNLSIIVGNFKDVKISKKFDYVTLIGVLEYAPSYIEGSESYKKMLLAAKRYLKPNGKIIIAIENKMGLKYWNGAKEDHVGERFAGIEDYKYISKVRTFSKPELIKILNDCGLKKVNFYYPTPDYKLPDTIYSEKFMPKRGSLRTWNSNYSETRIALYNEAIVADQICDDKVFDYFSNSFLAIVNEKENNIGFIHYRKLCKKEYQTKTELINNDRKYLICKSYLNNVSREYDIFRNMINWYETLQKENRRITYLVPQIGKNNSSITYDYIEGNSLEEEVGRLVHNIPKMIKRLKEIIKKYYGYSSQFEDDFIVTEKYKKVFGEIWVDTPEKSLKVTNLDMLLQNMVLKDGNVYCFDYEWIFDFPIPYEFVIYRCITIFYNKYNMYFSKKLNRVQLLSQVGIKSQNIHTYDAMEKKFQEKIYGKNLEEYYLKQYEQSRGMIEIKGI